MLSVELLEPLVRRLREARAKSRLQAFLKRIKKEQDVPVRKFRSSGTIEQLIEAVEIAARDGLISATDLAALVDEVEENGGQHVFLFDLTPAGIARARSRALKDAFQTLPAQPTPGMYADLPAASRVYFVKREDTIVIKQIFRASYWEKDETRSYERDNERATFIVRRQRRAINLLRLEPRTGRAEIRIDRVRGQMDDRLAMSLLADFQNSLKGAFDFQSLVTPLEIWRGFPRIVKDRTRTYMSTDGARDASVSVNISNRREKSEGGDVRDHRHYRFSGTDYSRDTLNVYWFEPGNEDEKFHSILSREEVNGQAVGKVYVAAKLTPAQLAYVLDTIRQFTVDPS